MPNQSEMCYYNSNLVLFTKIQNLLSLFKLIVLILPWKRGATSTLRCHVPLKRRRIVTLLHTLQGELSHCKSNIAIYFYHSNKKGVTKQFGVKCPIITPIRRGAMSRRGGSCDMYDNKKSWHVIWYSPTFLYTIRAVKRSVS